MTLKLPNRSNLLSYSQIMKTYHNATVFTLEDFICVRIENHLLENWKGFVSIH